MSAGTDPDDLISLVADERLLAAASDELPAAVGRPEAMPDVPARRRVVGAGVAMTGLTLVGGIALIVLGAISLLVDGGGAGALIAVIAGGLLAGTHWGWAHVAELTAAGMERRASAPAAGRRREWLAAIAPFVQYEVVTRALDDGSLVIERVRWAPVRLSERTFGFAREVELAEVHAGDEPGAAIAERAELLRREAAADTARSRRRFLEAAESVRDALSIAGEERERRLVQAAESRALADQINANLRDPPLME